MSIRSNQILTVSSVNEMGWALAKNENGETGWVPFDFLTRIEGDAASANGTDDLSKAMSNLKVANQSLAQQSTNAAAPAGADDDTCFACKKSLAGSSALSARGRQFHPDCFTCTECKTSLAAIGFLEKDNKYYCEKDYYKVYGHTCYHCKEVIIGSHIMGNGHPYHLDHLLCAICNKSIGTDLLHVKDDKTICHDCYSDKFASKCVECGLPIEYQVFTALDKTYHKECFKCAFDGHPMEDEAFHAHEGKVYCPTHFKQLFGKQCSGCLQAIEGQYLQVLDKYFHAECWKCTSCQALLSETGCVKREDKFYCPPCGAKVPMVAPKAPAKPAASAAPVAPGADSAPAPAPTAEEMRKRLLSAAGLDPNAAVEEKEEQVEMLPEKPTYTLEELQNTAALPPNVSRAEKERYLSDDDFQKHFNMNRAQFAELKLWKQQELKKALRIF